MARVSNAVFYKNMFRAVPTQPFWPSLQSHLQPYIPLLDLQKIIMEYVRNRFQGQTNSTLHVGKASRYMAMTTVGDRLFVADGHNHINAYEYMSTEEWQRTGFWLSSSMVTQLGSYGQHLVSSDYNGEVFVWNPSDGSLVHKFIGHTARVMAFAQVNGFLATCSYDKTVRLWTLSQTSEVGQIMFRSSLPTCMVAWDGKLVVGDSRADVQIFDCEEGVWTCSRTFGGFSGQLTSLVACPYRLLCIVNGRVYSLHPNDTSVRSLIYTAPVENQVCAVDGLILVGYNNRVALHASDGPLIRHVMVRQSFRGMVAISDRLAVATSDGFLTFFD